MGVTFEAVSEDQLPRDVWKRMSDKVKLFEHLEGCIVTEIDEIPEVWHIYMADHEVTCPGCNKQVHNRVGYDIVNAVCIECNGGLHEQKQ
jgi:hypothetical protein